MCFCCVDFVICLYVDGGSFGLDLGRIGDRCRVWGFFSCLEVLGIREVYLGVRRGGLGLLMVFGVRKVLCGCFVMGFGE